MTLYLHYNPKIPIKTGKEEKKKEHYEVYGTFQEEELSEGVQLGRLGYALSSTELESGYEVYTRMLEIGEKITMWRDYKTVNVCVCNPLIIKYCIKKKHNFDFFFVRFLIKNRKNLFLM